MTGVYSHIFASLNQANLINRREGTVGTGLMQAWGKQ